MKFFTLKTTLCIAAMTMLGACSTNETFVEETTPKKDKMGLVDDSDLKTTIVDGVVMEGEFDKQAVIKKAYSVHYDHINSALIIYTSESKFKKDTKNHANQKMANDNLSKIDAVSTAATPTFYNVKHRNLGFFLVQADTGSDHVIGFQNFNNNTTYLATGHWVQDGSTVLNLRTNYTLNTITNHAKNPNSIVYFRNCATSNKYLVFYSGTEYTGTTTKYSLLPNTHSKITFPVGSTQKSMRASLTVI
jgi:hypothetical protein